jgi:exodeoxyribonuclease V alpha subunit
VEEFSALDFLFSRKIGDFTGIDEYTALQKLMKSAREGHLCLPLSELQENERTKLIENKNRISEFVRIDDENVYLEKNYEVERIIKDEILRLSKPTNSFEPSLKSIHLNNEQFEAVRICLENRLTFLTGGPGTGKTYTASAIVSAFDPNQQKRIALTAPTGRAADHLQASIYKNCGVKYPSCTLHKLLKIGAFSPWPKEKFLLDLNLLIIDEASMIDAPLFATLLKAIPDHCTTIFMGDPNQLSPVGIGNVFHDLIVSNRLKVVRASLKHSMRTDNEEILRISHQVLHGKMPEITFISSLEFKQFSTSETPDPEQVLQSFSKSRILNCLRVGPQGADAFNDKSLKRTIAATQKGKWWGAPIMIINNDDEAGLCNGELGIYMEKKGTRESGFAYFPNKQLRIPVYALPKFEWSFCSSVHKSQGCEYEEVIILIPPGSEIFGREMLYTAITRAKRSIKIMGDKQTFQSMLDKSFIKHSGLR